MYVYWFCLTCIFSHPISPWSLLHICLCHQYPPILHVDACMHDRVCVRVDKYTHTHQFLPLNCCSLFTSTFICIYKERDPNAHKTFTPSYSFTNISPQAYLHMVCPINTLLYRELDLQSWDLSCHVQLTIQTKAIGKERGRRKNYSILCLYKRHGNCEHI